MKPIHLITFFVAILLFSSCGKDSSESIIGTWSLTDVEVLPGCNEPEIENFSVEDGCIIADGESSCITFIFLEDDIAQLINTFDNESETFDLTYTYNEGSDVIMVCAGNDCNNLTFSGDEIRLSAEEDGCELVYIFEKD
jgi:hypothetical protein